MKPALHLLLRSLALGALVVAVGCGEDTPSAPGRSIELPDSAAAAFSLVDVNPNSATHLQRISPRHFVGSVSAWYFGHST